MSKTKKIFLKQLKKFTETLTEYVSTNSGEWSIKGFIDIEKNIYTISSDSKIISKILEIQLFPKFKEFAEYHGYEIVLAEKQNWYPDLSFVTLGSHGEYFRNRISTKNIQFPYSEYTAHLSLGVLYSRALSTDIDETEILKLSQLNKVTSVIKDLVFFAEEKWKISSDKGGSGNTANIGSINFIEDILKGNGVFVNLGEEVFNEYWINQNVLQVPDKKKKGSFKKLTKLSEFLEFKGMDISLINSPKPKRKNKK